MAICVSFTYSQAPAEACLYYSHVFMPAEVKLFLRCVWGRWVVSVSLRLWREVQYCAGTSAQTHTQTPPLHSTRQYILMFGALCRSTLPRARARVQQNLCRRSMVLACVCSMRPEEFRCVLCALCRHDEHNDRVDRTYIDSKRHKWARTDDDKTTRARLDSTHHITYVYVHIWCMHGCGNFWRCMSLLLWLFLLYIMRGWLDGDFWLMLVVNCEGVCVCLYVCDCTCRSYINNEHSTLCVISHALACKMYRKSGLLRSDAVHPRLLVCFYAIANRTTRTPPKKVIYEYAFCVRCSLARVHTSPPFHHPHPIMLLGEKNL